MVINKDSWGFRLLVGKLKTSHWALENGCDGTHFGSCQHND